MRKPIFAFLIYGALIAPFAAVSQVPVRITPAERRLTSEITADQLSAYLHFVASDAMGGRDTPSPGLDATAEFLKMNLTRWGLKPAGDSGTFFQRIALKSETIDTVNNLLQIDGKDYKINDEFFRLSGNGSANALMYFAGHGWVVKSKNINPYQAADIKGKVVVITSEGFPSMDTLTRPPASVVDADLTGNKGTDWSDPLTYARQHGAAGILLIASPQAQAGWGQIRRFFSRANIYPEKLRQGPTAEQDKMPVMLVSSGVADAIIAGAGVKESVTGFAIDRTVSMTAMSRSETKYTQNVVAIWEGRDPVLKNEMVAIGAHYDHDGTNPNAPGEDKIWNGADDDGSGTVAVLAIAEALGKARIRPKRSVLFVWHAGEEKGLWGSEYFNKFPTVEIKNVVAQINIDMIGRSKKPGDTNPKNKELSGENEIYVIGSEMMSSTLGSIVKATNKSFLNLSYNYRYDDPKDTNRFFFRSDHFHYAVNG
ncbi:MAG: M28 family peptidase, partial [Acidobacteria bacterium]|nr:M28 family peptidase [Acidobacteriota bacterium]